MSISDCPQGYLSCIVEEGACLEANKWCDGTVDCLGAMDEIYTCKASGKTSICL